MGQMIRISCHKCEIDREVFSGVGLMGVGKEFCPCYHCHRFVMKNVDYRKFDPSRRLHCPYCRKEVQPLEKGDQCAVCGGRIKYEVTGVWD